MPAVKITKGKIMSSIRSSLLCVSFHISAWEGRKLDKKATRETAEKHALASGVARTHKDLLPGADEHAAILKLRGAWRKWHADETLAWGDDGQRVIKSADMMEYGEGFRVRKGQWDVLVEEFCDAYPMLVAKAEMSLNTLYNPADYPSVADIRRRFGVSMRTFTLPNADDFRIVEGITPEEAEALRQQAIEGLETQVTEALRDLWGRMHTVVSAMHERLSIPVGLPGAKFHDTLTGNIEELLERIPKLNLTNDPEITAIADQMRDLVSESPDTLRNAPDVRSETAKRAAALAKRMSQYVGDE
jgi:hypothetical protein